MKTFMIKIINLKLVIVLGCQNIKTFLQKLLAKNWLKGFFLWLKKLKILCLGLAINDLNGEEEEITKGKSKRV